MSNLISRFTKSSDGTSAVEFALIAPLFLAIVFGMIVLGSHLAIVHGVQQLAAEAARVSVAGLSDTERRDLASQYVTSNVSSYALLSVNQITVSAAASPANANVFVVTVNYDASQLPFYTLPFVPTPSPLIARSAAIPRGGY